MKFKIHPEKFREFPGLSPRNLSKIPEGDSKFKISQSSIFNLQFSIGFAGFTLIEIMIVVVILGLLASLVTPKIMNNLDKAKVVQTKVQIENFESSLKLFKLDNGFYPSTEQGLKALVEKPTTGKIPENYAEGGYLEKKRVPLDAWGNPYIYICPGTHGDFDIISYGEDGKEGGEGFNKDIYSWEL